MKVLVTGAAGFIGYHVALRLAESKRCEVLGIDNLNDYYSVELKRARLAELERLEEFRFVQSDFADVVAFTGIYEAFKPDYVIHLGAQAGVRYSTENPAAYARSNLDGFLNVLESCRRTPPKHLVFASSSSVYGAGAKVRFREQDRRHVGPAPRSVHREETQAGDHEAVKMRVTVGHQLIALLGRAVERDRLIRVVVLAKGDFGAGTIHTARRRKYEMLGRRSPARFEHVEKPIQVAPGIRRRIFRAVTHSRLRAQMNHIVRLESVINSRERDNVGEITLHKAKLLQRLKFCETRPL